MTRLEFSNKVQRRIKGEHDRFALVLMGISVLAFVTIVLWGVV